MSNTSNSPPRAIIVSGYFPLPEKSGGRKRAARLIQCMQDAGMVPVILTPERLSAEQAEVGRQRGWRVESFQVPPRSFKDRLGTYIRRDVVLHSVGLSSRLHELARDDPVLIQAEEIETVQYLLRVRTVVPTVASFHNVDSKARRDPTASRLPRSRALLRQRSVLWRMSSVERRAVRIASTTICVSEADRQYFEGLGAACTLLVPNGVDECLLDMPLPTEETTDVLFFGTLEYAPNRAGIAEFIQRVWPKVAAAVPDARLRIAGLGTSDRLLELAGRAERVDVLGFVPSLELELRRARCVVAPIPYGGGTRIKVLEALAAGRPVVGTAVGVEHLGFEHNRHGFVANNPHEMADHAIRLLQDSELSRRLAGEGRRLASAYTWPRVLTPARELYRDWLGAWRQPVRRKASVQDRSPAVASQGDLR